MKIALLCRNPHLYSHKRIIAAAKARGHEIDTINHLRCTIDIASHRPKIHYRGEVLGKYDAVIPRIGASVTFFGAAVVRQFEMMRVIASTRASRSRAPATNAAACSCPRKGIGLPSPCSRTRPRMRRDRQACRRRAGGDQLLKGRRARPVVPGETPKARLDHRGVADGVTQHPRP
jgi:ribosomal protein S6--L-glutamate ligase